MSVRRIAAFAVASLAVQAGGAGFSAPAHAEFDITFAQVGANVVATGAGSVNLNGLTDSGALQGNGTPFVTAKLGAVGLVTTAGAGAEAYYGLTGPSAFGSGNYTAATTGTGPIFGVNGGNSLIFVPTGYVSGTFISDSATWNNATFASLGLTSGTYTEFWDIVTAQPSAVPAGAATVASVATDEVRVVIPASITVPEPVSLALLALPAAFLLLVRRRMAGAEASGV